MGAAARRVSNGRAADAVRQWWWARQRSRPPHPPRGWHTGPPAFVGVGVQKAGTTWWYRLITRHPGVVSRGHPKELHYFDLLADRFTPADAARYSQWFPRPPGAITGEWTPRYMADDHTPAQLAMAAPDARLLVLLRDPVERYISGVTMQVARGWPPDDANAIRRGLYASQLERLYEWFAPEQVLALQYERCVEHVVGELARTYRFLDLDPDFVPRSVGRRINIATRPAVAVDPDRIRALVAQYEPDVTRLQNLGVEIDLWRWPHFRHLGA